ncbi:MAG: cofactor-independent phosphoglycerate mutase [Deltaproteobacteria bacterium]|nr:cofactor-independent phosphoglycerate mutase [Deltaproteobacteria bacterium]MBM4323701.1 cofactor-independent phosphoglycerate mutase [Deltaproteobacteria bacterium]
MKYVVIIGDGMADYPVESLHGKTPLMVARTPHLDWLAKHGNVGLVKTVPEGFNPGSEIANLSIFGYDPQQYYTGRGPLEAASLGVELKKDDLAFRCNLVTLEPQGSKVIMEDFAAGHISDAEAREIIIDLDRAIGTEKTRFYSGVSYRHLMVMKNGASAGSDMERLELIPPHDIIGQEITPFLPRNAGSGSKILALMSKSQQFLKEHPINIRRRVKGVRPANSVWLWGQGRSPQMVTLRERFGVDGYVISAVHLIKGIGLLAGLEVLQVPGITGYLDTNYKGKGEYALQGLEKRDFVYIHVEAPDEAGHMGDLRLKVEAIEAFDEKVVGTILKGIKSFEKVKVMVLPDHPTPLSVRTHTADPVPFVIYSSDEGNKNDPSATFDEDFAQRSGVFIEKGSELIERFLAP